MATVMEVLTIKPGEARSAYPTTDLASGAAFPVEKGDNGILLVLNGTAAADVTIQGGDGVFAGGNRVISLPENETVYVYLESGPFIQHAGENKGMIVVEPASGVNCIAVQLV